MTRVIGWVFLFAATFAAAEGAPPIRICVAPLENHSIYQLPIDKLQSDLVLQLSHKHISAVNIKGQDLSDEMAKNSCEIPVARRIQQFRNTARRTYLWQVSSR